MGVIIWGAGSWGEQVYWFYNTQDEILFYVDKDENKIGKKVPWGSVEVKRVESIRDYQGAKIVIAINERSGIKKILESMEINEEFIDYLTIEKVKKYLYDYLPRLDDYKKNGFDLKRYLKDMYLWRHGYAKESTEYYPTLANILKREKDGALEKIKLNIKDVDCLPARIIALRLMYEYDCFDSECMKLFMDSLLKSKIEDDTNYGLVMDTTYMVHKHFDYIYDDFYAQRRRLLKRLAENYNLTISREINKSVTEKRVAILCHCDLYFEKSNMARESIVASYANALQNLDVQVNIFILCSIYRTEDKNVFLREYVHLGMGNNNINERISRYIDPNIKIHRFYDVDIKRRMQKSIDAIVSYNPSYILDISDECSLQPYVLQNVFPVVYLPMRRRMSSSFFDAYVTTNRDEVLADNKIYNSIPSEKIFELRLGCLPEEMNNLTIYTREEKGFCKEDFLIVTVGSRLKYEITDDIITAMIKLCERCVHVRWILVGDKISSSADKFLDMISSKRIILWGYEENITALYKICDAYFQPDRPGGALSIRQAMREGLPIIMSDYPSDQKQFMDSEDLINGDVEDLTLYAENLYHDKKLYIQVSRRMKKMVSKYSIDKDAKMILDLLELVRVRKSC